ncbi:MAG: hypothetical protein WC783_03325 [Candidatus Paceibacterota bacterium]|jgi:hypothetical protein
MKNNYENLRSPHGMKMVRREAYEKVLAKETKSIENDSIQGKQLTRKEKRKLKKMTKEEIKEEIKLEIEKICNNIDLLPILLEIQNEYTISDIFPFTKYNDKKYKPMGLLGPK